MTLKWRILWICFFIIFDEYTRDGVFGECESGCVRKRNYPPGEKVKITPRTQNSIGIPSINEEEKFTGDITGVCQANESFWRAIRLPVFFQKHSFKDVGGIDQEKSPSCSEFEPLQRPKEENNNSRNSRADYNHRGLKLENPIYEFRGIDTENLLVGHSSRWSRLNDEEDLILGFSKYFIEPSRYRGRKNILINIP